MNSHCLYYQAHVPTTRCSIFVALMRSCEHVAFDRTVDVATSTFEFFVPADQKAEFISFMEFCLREKLIENLIELPNRLSD